MKTTILTLLTLGLCASIHAESITTADGKTYDNVTFKRADPDGLYLEYSMPGNGLGMSKVKFARLSEDQRKQFGYDAGKAKEFEAQTAKANEEWRASTQRTEQEARATRAERLTQATQEQTMQTQRMLAVAQLKQAEAELSRATGSNGNYEGGWGGGFAIPSVDGRVPRATTTYAPIVRPVPFPRVNSPLTTGGGRR